MLMQSGAFVLFKQEVQQLKQFGNVGECLCISYSQFTCPLTSALYHTSGISGSQTVRRLEVR